MTPKGAYYNEIDPKAAAWLRELVKGGYIAPGDVDNRSIEDVLPSELANYAQCHFFAGIGGWSYALRRAGWPDDRPVWTGSCPCQPFSAAGKGAGFADERHLWPAWHWLIRQCQPNIIFGEQVANALAWWDLVSTDLEGEGYTSGAAIIGAHSVGAPHIRQRLYWLAESGSYGRQRRQDAKRLAVENSTFGREGVRNVEPCGGYGKLAESPRQYDCWRGDSRRRGQEPTDGSPNVLAYPHRERQQERRELHSESGLLDSREAAAKWHPIGVCWEGAEYVACSDGKARPIEPGTFPLAHGVPHRVGLLRGYGNAIVADQAQAFIEAAVLAPGVG
jgi:DNA (cytosine-5)-methyltransferase 1